MLGGLTRLRTHSENCVEASQGKVGGRYMRNEELGNNQSKALRPVVSADPPRVSSDSSVSVSKYEKK